MKSNRSKQREHRWEATRPPFSLLPPVKNHTSVVSNSTFAAFLLSVRGLHATDAPEVEADTEVEERHCMTTNPYMKQAQIVLRVIVLMLGILSAVPNLGATEPVNSNAIGNAT